MTKLSEVSWKGTPGVPMVIEQPKTEKDEFTISLRSPYDEWKIRKHYLVTCFIYELCQMARPDLLPKRDFID